MQGAKFAAIFRFHNCNRANIGQFHRYHKNLKKFVISGIHVVGGRQMVLLVILVDLPSLA